MFYEKLNNLLQERHLTLNKLAKGCGIAQSQTSKWKKGYLPGTEILIKICKYLNVSADYLLDLDETPPPPHLSDQEQKLLEYYRQCKPDIQRSIMMLANSGAKETVPQEEAQVKSLTSRNAG